MKLIGITGSSGKTSVAEIVYQYLLYRGYNASLYCSNGMFCNGLTRVKDFFQTTLYGKELLEFLEEDKKNEVEYAIIEITAESVNRNDSVHLLPYDVVALTNFFSGLHNHFEGENHYFNCKKTILSSQKTKNILIRYEDPNYSMFSDLDHITYGYSDEADYQMVVVNNTINGLKLYYDKEWFTTNLITGYHGRNMACALAILSVLEIMDIHEFKEFAKNIFIRGRFEKFTIKDKTVIIDTGFVGTGLLLSGLEQTIGNKNYKTIFSNVHYSDVNDWVINARKNVGKYLKESKFIYLTNPTNEKDEEEIFLRDVIADNNFTRYKYIPSIKDACLYALNELDNNETLVIICRNHYREYRKVLENLKSSII